MLRRFLDADPAPLAPMPRVGLRTRFFKAGAEGNPVEERDTIIATTDEEDRYGDVVDQKTLVLGPYRENPVLLYAHNSWGVVVGNADPDSLEVREGIGLTFSPVWDDHELNPMGQLVAHQWGRFLRTVSIGFMPGRVRRRSDLDEDHYAYAEKDPDNPWGGLFFEHCEILEISVTPVPANRGAHQLGADQAGDALERALLRLVRENPSIRQEIEAIALSGEVAAPGQPGEPADGLASIFNLPS